MKNIKTGSVVAFNKLADAVWFEVLYIDKFTLAVKENETNNATQYIDISLVKQVK